MPDCDLTHGYCCYPGNFTVAGAVEEASNLQFDMTDITIIKKMRKLSA